MEVRYIVITDDPGIKAGHDRISGALRYAATKPDWTMRVINSSAHDFDIRTRLATTTGLKLDGIIGVPDALIASGLFTRRMINRIPTVSARQPKRSYRGFWSDTLMVLDDEAIGRSAADILLRRGLSNLAYVANDPLASQFEHDAIHSRIREAKFKAAALAAGMTCAVYHSNPREDWTTDLDKLAAWIARLPRPCGIFAFNDKRAQKVVDACHLAHVTIPDQIRLVGVDNEIEICENLRPTLTSIQPDFEACGYLAAQALDDILTHGRPKSPRKIGYGIKRIVERASTQDLKGGGRIVAQAREYMRQHATEQIALEDVARNLNLSVRTLSLRFREILHASPGEILRGYRLELARQLLAETDRPVNDIAENSGFASASHLKHLFKKTYGQTPGEYRRRR